jgi:hypothetical protein
MWPYTRNGFRFITFHGIAKSRELCIKHALCAKTAFSLIILKYTFQFKIIKARDNHRY